MLRLPGWDELLVPAISQIEVAPAAFASPPPGFFVDVGANDPVIYSQTFDLEQRGWTGVLVEPLPEMASALRARRKARVYEVACSSTANEGKELTFYVAGKYSSLLSQSVTAGVRAVREIRVQARTLDSILRDANAPVPIDFASIDVEGHEIAVLDGFDLKLWRPRFLLVEDLAMNRKLHRYLAARGYRWFRRGGLNAWYAPAESAPPVSAFGRWQYFRKHYLALPFRHAREMKRRVLVRPVKVD